MSDKKDIAQNSPEASSKDTKSNDKTKKVIKEPKNFSISKFFKDLKAEVKKIVWPTRKAVINNTGIVLVAMVISGVFIWGIDTGFKFLFDLLLQR